MVTVNSLSGGKTSSYLAYHYPADIEIFALVCIDNHNAGKSIDPKIKQMVNDKLQKASAYYPEFVATSEDSQILKTMLDLEQLLGREIVWVRGEGWEQMLERKKIIPNMMMRFCTSELKIKPIFEYLYYRHLLPCKMRLGFRMDEIERKDRATTIFKHCHRSDYRVNSDTWVNRWEEVEWRVNKFPLIDHGIWHFDVQSFWKKHDIQFPEDSNCQNCFWKHPQQLRKNFDTNPDIMRWSAIWEDLIGGRFKKEYSLLDIQKLGLQQEFNFGTGSGCQAGFCTD